MKHAGQWKKGQSGNPAGKPAGNQDFVDRLRYLVNQHTIAGIEQIVTDKEKFGALSVYDGMIIRRIAESIDPDGRQSMDSLLDRILGKPKQTMEVDQTVKAEITITERREKAAQEANDLLATLSARKGETPLKTPSKGK